MAGSSGGPDTPPREVPDSVSGPLDALGPVDAAGPLDGNESLDAPQPVSGREVGTPPALLRGRGDLTLVLGLGGDAIAAARAIAEAIGDAEVRPGGCARAAAPRIDDRRGALRARADGVRRERPIVAAFGLAGGASEVPGLTESLAGIEPDQVWVAVDASRKPEDTADWVRA